MKRRRARALALVAPALALLLASSLAVADLLESGPFRLDWATGAGCPNAVDALTRIEALLGAPVAEVLKVPLTARGRVQAVGPERFELTLETFQGDQRFTRDMQGPSCGELTDAAVLVLALAIDPELQRRLPLAVGAPGLTREASPSVPAPAPSVPPARVVPLPAPMPVRDEPVTPPAPKSTRALGLWGGVALLADSGSVAPIAFGPAATFGARRAPWELDLDAAWLPPQRSFAALDPDKGGDIALVVFTLRPCAVARPSPFEAGLCGAFELGDIWGTGFGTATRNTKHSLWIAAGGVLFARYRLHGQLFLSLRAALLAPLQDIEFTLENVGLVYQVPPLVGRGILGVDLHFD